MTALKTIIRSGYVAKKTAIGAGYIPFITIIRAAVVQPSGQMYVTCSISIIGAASLKATAFINAISDNSISASAKLLGTSFITPSGSISITGFTAMIGVGLMVANSTAAFTGSATLVGMSPGSGIMTGNAAISVSGQSTIIAVGLMVPSASMSVTGSAGLTNTGYMIAVATMSVTGSASIAGVGLMTATSTLQVTTSANVIGIGVMVGNADMSVTGGSVIKAIGIMAGESSASIAGNVVLKATGLMIATATSQITASATLKATGKMIGNASTSITGSATVTTSYDADAQAFFTFIEGLGGSMTSIEKSSTSTLVTSLKAHGLWSKTLVIHGVGSTAITQLANLKDPRDLDAAFRGVKTGTITHSSTGYDPNGSTGYIDTKFSPLSHGTQNSMGFFYYSRQNNTGSVQMSMGCYDGASASTNINHSTTANSGRVAINQNDSDALFVIGVTDTRGFWHAVRSSSTTLKLYINGAVNASDTVNTSNTPISQNVFEGARNSGSGGQLFCNQACGISGITLSMTDAEALDFYNDWLTWLTANSRQN